MYRSRLYQEKNEQYICKLKLFVADNCMARFFGKNSHITLELRASDAFDIISVSSRDASRAASCCSLMTAAISRISASNFAERSSCQKKVG